MTVRELIAQLQALPNQDAIVLAQVETINPDTDEATLDGYEVDHVGTLEQVAESTGLPISVGFEDSSKWVIIQMDVN